MAIVAGVERSVQLALIDGAERPVGKIPGSVFFGPLNCDLLAAVAPLYLTGSVLDVTYGNGGWWRRFQPQPFASHDLLLDQVDFRALPEGDRSWDTVCFDPPYVPRSGGVAEPDRRRRRERVYRGNYGLDVSRGQRALRALMFAGLAECSRVARRFVLVKCTDYVNARHLTLMHAEMLQEGARLGLKIHDLIIHASGSGPGGQQIFTIQRARRAHSYLLVFRVPLRRAGQRP